MCQRTRGRGGGGGGENVKMRRAEQENGAGVVLSKVEEEEETGLQLSIQTEGWNSSCLEDKRSMLENRTTGLSYRQK